MENNNKISVFVAQTSQEEVDSLEQKLNDSGFIVVGKTTDGKFSETFFEKGKADIALIDLALKNIDGYLLLESIRKNCPTCKVVVLSGLTHPSFSSKAYDLGAICYLKKPCEFDELKSNLTLAFNQTNYTFSNSLSRGLDKKLSSIFITVGIPAHIKGYQFLREAIKLAIDSPDIINSITKKLYPSIAEKFETSSSKVERAIRHAIEVAWNRGKIENINEIFGLKIYSPNDKPTNGEFIALVADKMLIEGA